MRIWELNDMIHQTIVLRQGKAFPPGDTKVLGNPWVCML